MFNILLLFLVVTFSALNELLTFSKSQNPDKPRQDLKQYFSLCYHNLRISCSREECIKVLSSRWQIRLPILTSSKCLLKGLAGCLMSVVKGVKN